MLGDVFGCSFESSEQGSPLYVRASTPRLEEAIAPQRYLEYQPTLESGAVVPRVHAAPSTKVLGKLSLPYRYPSPGSVTGRDYASIHASPPWIHTDHPVLCQSEYGAGICIYSALPIEADESEAGEKLFTSLIASLLGDASSFTARTHADVWVNAHHQPEQSRYVVSALHYAPDTAPTTVPMTFAMTLPEGTRVTFVSDVDGATAWNLRHMDGSIEVEGIVRSFAMLVLPYEASDRQ
jgi:hypothetical protein